MATDRDFQYDLRPHLQPLLLPVCALASGMVASEVASLGTLSTLAGSGIAAATAGVALRLGSTRLAGAVLLVAVSLGGASWSAAFRSAADARPIRQLVDTGQIRAGDRIQLDGTVEDVPERRPSGVRIRLSVSSLRFADGERLDVRGRATIGLRIGDAQAGSAMDGLGLERGSSVRIAAEASDDLAFRNPGVETLRSRLRRNGLDLAAHAAGPHAIEITGPAKGCPLLRRLSAARVWGLAEINAAFEPRTAGVLRALLLGDESHLDEETAESYRRSGAYHVLVISGAHVALVAGLSIWIAGRVSNSPVLRLLSGAGPAWLYALVLGGPAPVVRAALGVTVALLAPLVGRRAPPPNTLALAAGVVLIADPTAIRDPSFQLTFGAVAAIVCIAAPAAERLADIGRWRPHRATPYPPVCSLGVKAVAEALYWDEGRFRSARQTEAVRFGVTKTAVAVWLGVLRLQGAIRRTAIGIWIALVVQLTLAPFAVTSFGRTTLTGTVWALAVEILLGFTLIAGLGFLALRFAAPAVSPPVEWSADRLVVLSNAVAADAPAGWPMAEPAGWSAVALWAAPVGVAVAAALVAGWRPLPRSRDDLVRPRSRARGRFVAAVAAVVLVGSISVPEAEPVADGNLSVLFLDVGQGDAAFIRFPNGTTMLVDAGGRPRFDAPLAVFEGQPVHATGFDIGDRVVSASLLAQGFSSADVFVATHGDIDHTGGFGAVIRRLSVGRVIVGAGADASEKRFARFAADHGLGVETVAAGESIAIGDARLEVLWPTANAPPGNDGSLVFRVVFGQRSVLFTGDIEEAGETALLQLASANGWDIRADVIKVAHHGSRGASSRAFLAAVAPRWAVVSAPRLSPYGHPHPETVGRLRSAGATVLQTGVDGAVAFVTDGVGLALRRIAEPGTQLLPPVFDHGARSDRTKSPGGPP